MSDTAVREPSLTASRDAPLGGQAVLEGVMMRGVKHWAVAVRTPAAQDAPEGAPRDAGGDALGEIAVQEFQFGERPRLRRFARIPILRGVIALVESLGIGFKALSIAASAQLGEEAEELPGGIWAVVLIVAFAFAIGLFFIVPVTLVNLIKHQLGSSLLFWIVEGGVRTAIFLAYLWLLSRMRDLRRTFEYHGAEHKTISCYEAGDELTPDRAALYSRLHPRCGTSFLLVVMIVSIFVFAIVGLPIIIGVSFELIKWAGRNRRFRLVQAIMYPGLQLQRLTTREPSLDQLEVAIAALNAVLAHETPGAYGSDELVGVEVVA